MSNYTIQITNTETGNIEKTYDFTFTPDTNVPQSEDDQLQPAVQEFVQHKRQDFDAKEWEAIVINAQGNEVVRFDNYYIGH